MSLNVTELTPEQEDRIRARTKIRVYTNEKGKNVKETTIDEDKCLAEATGQVATLVTKLKEPTTAKPEYKAMSDEEKTLLTTKMTDFQKDKLVMETDQMLAMDGINDARKKIEKTAEAKKEEADLDEEVSSRRAARKKRFRQSMDYMAAGGLGVIAILLILAGYCAGSDVCGVEFQPVLDEKGQPKLDETTGKAMMIAVPKNIPLQILESQMMLALIGGVIAPVVTRVLKEKYDIQIEEGQVSMIMTDAIKAVKLYQNEANKLRDKDGYIPPEYQKKLRDLAFDSIRTSYEPKKYKELAKSVGAQIFDKAIEEAVKRGWIERFPLEKAQVEAVISQSIDALPQIVEWRNLDEDVKAAFLDGHVKRLLANVGLDGWGLQKLDEMFDAEVNRRLLAAAIADGKGLLTKLDASGPNRYMKYTTGVLVAVGESLGKEKQ